MGEYTFSSKSSSTMKDCAFTGCLLKSVGFGLFGWIMKDGLSSFDILSFSKVFTTVFKSIISFLGACTDDGPALLPTFSELLSLRGYDNSKYF